jgi:hypothetical protein
MSMAHIIGVHRLESTIDDEGGMIRVVCQQCQWWASKARKDYGECRRHAPRATNTLRHWVETWKEEFCGDAQRLPELDQLELKGEP